MMIDAQQTLSGIRDNIRKVIIGKDNVIDLMLISMVCSGHVLIEDMPGLGKTTLAAALASSLGCSFRRIQFTPDVLPSDITGFTMFNLKTGEQELHQGSIMNQIVLADEINRTSPKTQSALLEVMQENQVTIDGHTYPAPSPFMVLATQNPVETAGTFPLPEAQMDRFMMRLSMGEVTREEEMPCGSDYGAAAGDYPGRTAGHERGSSPGVRTPSDRRIYGGHRGQHEKAGEGGHGGKPQGNAGIDACL